MSNFKKIVLNISNTVKETISRFPLTIGVIVIISTFISICIDRNWVNGDLFLNITVFGYIFVCGTLLSESYFSKWIYRIITYSITGGISIVFTICINYSYLISKVNTKNLSTEAIRIAVGYGIILILLSLYKILKDSKLKFEEYLLKVFSNLFVSCITYIILNIGISLVSFIFIELMLEGGGGEFILRIQILLLGYFLINSFIFSISNVKDKNVNTFIRGLLMYVALPLVSIAMAIIYLYIMKIIILRDMPSNVIFRILVGIFVFAFPIWNMAGNFKENKVVIKAAKVLPCVFSPLMILEIYSLGVRVLNYGLTRRY